ncbi:hypothetical protein GCM10009810_30280 [Nostocoides vanveenii]|uniref:Antitoxin n=1 Tax=Nostocoides vanveenii TaxID=330835 RepID=A0ABP4X7K8_9MICO
MRPPAWCHPTTAEPVVEFTLSPRVARRGARCYQERVTQPVAINQRDLRLRSREIMDAVEPGESFTVTREGRDIRQLVPLPRRRRFVSRADFAASSAEAATPDLPVP